MARKITANVLTLIVALGIIYIGVSYLLTPETLGSSFGFPHWPTGEAADILTIKGGRDIVMGLIPLALFLTGQRRALGWVLLVETAAPIADGTLVLLHDGNLATAFGVHYATAALVIVAGVLQLQVARKEALQETLQAA
ncbi:DUF4267 domain-containing protein [Glycomyces buryatensis]|uniref:DUF4267 domain-containing protein n=1 Tax=Glycomyces buryatensis TaxID=2570927 RepID=A0A4V4HQ98_9ACTN|nr:DUF4267 domain-containing protein [Glycomyces buryatensis]THV32896.1 DUF4267 domain-containing protein [Glycomyces buryatensis]